MRRLPKLNAGTSNWALPLTEVASGALADLFLRGQTPHCVEHLGRALAEEPSLVLWSVCFGDRWRTHPPDGVSSIVSWILERGLSVFQWKADERELNPDADRKQLEQWRQLADKSVSVAQGAARLVEAEAAENREQVYLFALLHLAEQWLSSCGPSVALPACKPGVTCMPDWLVRFLQELGQVPPRTFRAVTIAQAAGGLQAVASIEAAADDPSPGEATPSGSLRQRWLETDDRLGRLLPTLTHRLARLRQLEDDFQTTLETEKLESLKALAYGASHEINNPLANISTRAQTLLREESNPERRRKLAVINSQAFRAHELIADMMLFARPPELCPATVDLTGLVDEVIAEILPEAEEQGTTIERVTSDDPVPATVDGGHLAVALRALCNNSLEAIGSGGRIEIFVQACDAPADSCGGQWVEILVSDTGPGIPLEARGHLFDPYFSGREAGRGLGLGLSKTWRIVNEHGGRIDAESRAKQGTTFTIQLPRDACPNTPTAS
jgi:signal transduction histidine kinase